MKRLIAYFLLVLFVALFIFAILFRPSREPVERTVIFFDTFVRISLYPTHETDESVLFTLLEKEFERIQDRFGYGDSSLPSLLAMQQDVTILSEEDILLLKRALQISQQTAGAFDITVGSLQKVWGFKRDDPHLPKEEEIESALHCTGSRQLEVLDDTIVLKDGVIIDLGGISKGYAVDRAVQLLKEKGITAGLIDAGGDLRVFGRKPDRSRWAIGIRHPEEQGSLLGTFEIDSGAVATSGNYERSFEENGILYHHIIDPRTGYPANGCVSVTIVADDAMTADAFATGIFVLGPARGMEVVENLSRIEAVIAFRKNGKMEVITSRGIDLQ